MKDYYYILGVKPTATTDQIKAAYRKLSKKLHPDLNQGDIFFEERFKEILEAYEILIDDLKRVNYDERRGANNFINDDRSIPKDDPPKNQYTSNDYNRQQNVKKYGIKDLLYQFRLYIQKNTSQFSIAFIITFILITSILFITAHFNSSLNFSKIIIYPPITFFIAYIFCALIRKLRESKTHQKDYRS